MAEAYLYASRGRYCVEVDKLRKIERFGVYAVTGKQELYYGEVCKMVFVENIVNAYHARANAPDPSRWLDANGEMGNLLAECEAIVEGILNG